MLFLGRRGGEKLTLHARDGELASPSARCSERFHRRECDRAAFEKHFLSLLSLAGCSASQYNFMVGAVRQRSLHSRLYLSLFCVCLKVRVHFVVLRENNAGIDATGLDAETACGEKAIGAGEGVDAAHENGLQRHTALFELMHCRCPQIDVWATEETTSHDGGRKFGLQKSVDHLFAHFEGVGADARTDYRAKIARIRPQGAHAFDGVDEDVAHHAAPTGVGGTNHTVLGVVEQHRHTVGGGDADANARQRSDQGIDIAQVAIALASLHFHQCFIDKGHPVGVRLMWQQELIVVDVQCCTQGFSALRDVGGAIATIVGEIETGVRIIGLKVRGQCGARCGEGAHFGSKCVVEKFHV